MSEFVAFVDVGMDGEWRGDYAAEQQVTGQGDCGETLETVARVWSEEECDEWDGWRLWDKMMRWM